jgi:hypothetical protein
MPIPQEFELLSLDFIYLPSAVIDPPIKKPKNQELTIEQKDENCLFSSKQVFLEHRIRSVKIL